jgi:hypothetical protein
VLEERPAGRRQHSSRWQPRCQRRDRDDHDRDDHDQTGHVRLRDLAELRSEELECGPTQGQPDEKPDKAQAKPGIEEDRDDLTR